MKKRWILVVLFFASSMICEGQNRITGTVKSKSDSVLHYFNVALLNAVDSTLIKGGAFVDGRFEFQEVDDGKYMLATSSIGFETNYKMLHIGSTNNVLNVSILLDNIHLDEVKVRGRIPKVINKSDRYVVEVENTSISDAGDALEALSRTPYVMVDPLSKKVSVAGRGSTLILINNRKITSDQELSVLSSQNIKQIEVIENPSAKYDAEGQSVINIVTTKPKDKGVNMSLRALYTKARKQSGQLQGDLTYVSDKLVLFGRYGVSDRELEGFNYYHNHYQKQNYDFESKIMDLHNVDRLKYNDYAIGMNYHLSPHQTMSLKYEKNSYNIGNANRTLTNVDKNGVHLMPLLNHRDLFSEIIRDGVNFNYQYKNNGFEVSWISDYYLSENITGYDVIEFYEVPKQDVKMKSDANFKHDIFSSQLDVKVPLVKKRLDVEFGTKYSMVEGDNINNFYVKENDQWVPREKFTSQVGMDEKIIALYGIFSYKMGSKVNMSAGVRYEKIKDLRKNHDGERIERTVEDLFPSANFSYVPKKNYSFRFSYSERIKRPSFNKLNNLVQYRNHYGTYQGNPLLKSIKYKTFSLSSKLNKVNFSLMASYQKYPIDMLYINDPVEIEYIATTYINTENRWKYSMNISRLFQCKFWSIQPFLSVSMMERMLIDDGVQYTNNSPGFYLKLTNQFDITKATTLDADFLYRKQNHSFKSFNDYCRVNLALRQKMFKDKLMFQIAYQYIPYRWNQVLDYSYKMIDYTWDADERNKLTLSLRYNFSTTKKRFKSKSSNDSELRRL
ncbi:TonB-dependent receptor family protein [Prolixibacteraceae bacterium]|nr:TonB-dependent receptor family protein [Prolixibacteraceae bacterium]